MGNQVARWTPGVGCVVAAVIASLLFGLLGSPGCGVVTDYFAARRAQSEASKLEAQEGKLEAQVQLENAKTYNEASGRALKADTYRAHPELYVMDAARCIVLIVLAVVAAIAVYIALYAWFKVPRPDGDG